MSSTQPKILRRHRKTLAGAVAAVAVGGLLAGCGSSSSTTASTANATPAAATSSSPQGVPPGIGKAVTGAAADKAKAAATAKYPGTVERVEQLSDGSYLVHVMQTSGGEVHVKVSKAFAVTGTETGPPGGANGAGPQGGFGTPVTGATADKAKAAALAKYPGTAERVVQLPDGSYEVHVITKSGGEVHVKVSKAFQVTGTDTGPPAGAAPPAANGTTTTQSS
jgi:hypothetical protein